MALDTLRAALRPPSDVPVDRAGQRVLWRRDRTVRAELYYWRRDRRLHPGLAADRSGPVCAVDHVPADCRVKVCVMEMWKTAACADGKPIHSTWKRTGLSHILQTGFPQRRRDRQFTHIPTTPAAAKIHPILSYPVWSRQRKTKKRAGVQPSDKPRNCTPTYFLIYMVALKYIYGIILLKGRRYNMLSDNNYIKILNYFDRQFWGRKTDETNWNYDGIILDWYFENSVFSIDYLDVADYFDNNGGFKFSETTPFSEQYSEIYGPKRLELIQAILNLLKASTINQDQSQHIISVISKVLARDMVKVVVPETGLISIKANDILDSGSYCNIVRVKDGILRKELRDVYKDDSKLQKRMRYEFENMEKLSGCPQILNVFDYDEITHSYLMEQADMNLASYLQGEIDLSFDERLKIVMDILKGMSYAHNHSIIHRDLHLGNVLKIGNDYVICDFGLSKDLSIVRSMKSSYTQKNNHLFVDPLALTDFTLLDKKSDIYSIGKMMDYIFTYNVPTSNHVLKTIVERCICRDKTLRYDSVDQIIVDIEITLKSQSEEDRKKGIISKILNNHYDSQVQEYILKLVASDRLSKFIVTNKLSSFWKLVLQFETVYQVQILKSIEDGYSNATGYGGWSNYDIFATIAYNLCLKLSEIEPKAIARRILEGCADIRYHAKDLLDSLPT